MGFTCGIVGLPNVGKSTLFNALTASSVDAANYPFCTIEPNVGVVPVPDRRLGVIADIVRPARVLPTTIEFMDIAGLVRGASTGEGLGNQFLAHIRLADAIVHVVRCFEEDSVVHVDGAVDPIRDMEVVQTELILKDLDTVERRVAETTRKSGGAEKGETTFLRRLREHLLAGRGARSLPRAAGETTSDLHLLTDKPVLYVCNTGEEQDSAAGARLTAVHAAAEQEGAQVVSINASMEADLAGLGADERAEFLRVLGLEETGLERVIRAGYRLLDLVTFFTTGPKEVRAWTVPRGTAASVAAGRIHSDFERGFIRAEVMKAADLELLGSEHAVREKGLLHIEGREYPVQDGDILLVRFHV